MKFSHHLFQTCMSFLQLLNTKEDNKQLTVAIDVHNTENNMEVYGYTSTVRLPTFFKISSFVFSRRKTHTGLEWHEGDNFPLNASYCLLVFTFCNSCVWVPHVVLSVELSSIVNVGKCSNMHDARKPKYVQNWFLLHTLALLNTNVKSTKSFGVSVKAQWR